MHGSEPNPPEIFFLLLAKIRHLPQRSDKEKAWLLRIAEGDEAAFTELVAFYGPQLEEAVHQVIRTDAAVKDIIQETFLHIWLDRERLPQLTDIRTWFFRIAYYRSYTWLRNRGIRQRKEELLPDGAVGYNEVEEHASFSETRRLVGEAIRQLPARTRQIYLLSREEDRSISEIAAMLDLAPQTVKNTLSNALKSMRKYLADQGVLLPAVLFMLPPS